jgi:hypothetical protein
VTEPEDEPTRFGSFEEFRAGQFEIARRISAAGRGDWNGEYDYTPYVGPGGRVLGATLSDGTILYDQMYVEYPLQDAFDKAGTTRTPEEREAIRDGLKTLFHEDNHLLAREGSRSRADAYGTNRDPGVREFEEGVTEAYSYARLDRFISETGFDEIVPGIHDVRGRSTYPNVAPAALEVAEGIGDRTGLGAEEVLDRLNRVDHEEKWDVATDLMYESSDLPGMAADDRERDATKARIRDAMRDRFTDLGNLRISRAEGITEQDVRASSADAGRAAIADANAEIDRMEGSYREAGRILDDRDLDLDHATPDQDRPTAEQDRATVEPTQDPPDQAAQQDRLDVDPALDASLDPDRWVPPTSESRLDRPVDRSAGQNPDPARTDTTDARDAADQSADDRSTRDRADRAGERREAVDRPADDREAVDRAADVPDNADRAGDDRAREVAEDRGRGDRAGDGRESAERGRQSGSGLDPISKLRDLTHGGQRPAGEAARAPSEHPQARHHGRGVHSPAQHNRRLRDQHRPQRDQGEGIER